MVVLAISSLSKCTDQVSTTQGTVVMKQPLGDVFQSGVLVLAIALPSKYTVLPRRALW